MPAKSELSIAVCFSAAADALRLVNEVATADTAAETSTELRFRDGGADMTGGEPETPEQAGKPAAARLLFSAETKALESSATAEMPDAMPLAADAEETDTMNATFAPETSRWRRATSVTPVTATASGPTLSDEAMAALKLACAVDPKFDALRPARVAEDEMV